MSVSLKTLQVRGIDGDISMEDLELIIENRGKVVAVNEDPILKKSVLIECTSEENTTEICQKLNEIISSGKQLTVDLLPGADDNMRQYPAGSQSNRAQNMMETENTGSGAQDDPNFAENPSRTGIANPVQARERMEDEEENNQSRGAKNTEMRHIEEEKSNLANRVSNNVYVPSGLNQLPRESTLQSQNTIPDNNAFYKAQNPSQSTQDFTPNVNSIGTSNQTTAGQQDLNSLKGVDSKQGGNQPDMVMMMMLQQMMKMRGDSSDNASGSLGADANNPFYLQMTLQNTLMETMKKQLEMKDKELESKDAKIAELKKKIQKSKRSRSRSKTRRSKSNRKRSSSSNSSSSGSRSDSSGSARHKKRSGSKKQSRKNKDKGGSKSPMQIEKSDNGAIKGDKSARPKRSRSRSQSREGHKRNGKKGEEIPRNDIPQNSYMKPENQEMGRQMEPQPFRGDPNAAMPKSFTFGQKPFGSQPHMNAPIPNNNGMQPMPNSWPQANRPMNNDFPQAERNMAPISGGAGPEIESNERKPISQKLDSPKKTDTNPRPRSPSPSDEIPPNLKPREIALFLQKQREAKAARAGGGGGSEQKKPQHWGDSNEDHKRDRDDKFHPGRGNNRNQPEYFDRDKGPRMGGGPHYGGHPNDSFDMGQKGQPGRFQMNSFSGPGMGHDHPGGGMRPNMGGHHMHPKGGYNDQPGYGNPGNMQNPYNPGPQGYQNQNNYYSGGGNQPTPYKGGPGYNQGMNQEPGNFRFQARPEPPTEEVLKKYGAGNPDPRGKFYGGYYEPGYGGGPGPESGGNNSFAMNRTPNRDRYEFEANGQDSMERQRNARDSGFNRNFDDNNNDFRNRNRDSVNSKKDMSVEIDSEDKVPSRGEFSPEDGERTADQPPQNQKSFQKLMETFLKDPGDPRIQKLQEKSKSKDTFF